MEKCKKCRFYLSCILACFSEKGCDRFEEKEANYICNAEYGTEEVEREGSDALLD